MFNKVTHKTVDNSVNIPVKNSKNAYILGVFYSFE